MKVKRTIVWCELDDGIFLGKLTKPMEFAIAIFSIQSLFPHSSFSPFSIWFLFLLHMVYRSHQKSPSSSTTTLKNHTNSFKVGGRCALPIPTNTILLFP